MDHPNDYLDLNEIKALFNVIYPLRDYAIISLILTTGIHIRELIELKIDDVDWNNRCLNLMGKRPRKIQLSDQTYEALVQWSREREDTPLPFFFLTTKGAASHLSESSIDHMIRKYAKMARLRKKVNYNLLRHTYAVRLFDQEDDKKRAAEKLGITDPASIQRYALKAQKFRDHLADQKAHVRHSSDFSDRSPIPDTRSPLVRFFTKLFPLKPNSVRKRTDHIMPITAEPEEIIFGRDDILKQIRQCIANRRSILLTGPYGIGHTHILKHCQHLHTPSIFIGTPIPIREFLIRIANHLDPDWSKKLPTRPTLQTLTDFICQNRNRTDKQSPVIIIDQLDRLRATDQDILLQILEHFVVLAAIHDMPDRLKPVWWKFQLIEVPPLDKESSRKLIRYLTQNLTISDYDLLETKLLAMSNGFPLAITDMIHTLNAEKIVTTNAVRNLYHDAGTKYRSWASAIVVVWALVVGFRFIALGVHSFEGYILAGIGTSVLLVIRYFVMRLR